MLIRSTIAVALLLLSPISAKGAATPEEVHADLTRAVASEAEAQSKYVDWTDKKLEMSDEIRDMKAMDDWLGFQNKKYAKYIERQKVVIAELERRKEEAKRIRMELEPFLETVVDTLDGFVARDLQFLPEERQARIAFLHTSLDDYRLSLSEKLRRVFEALLVETEYGRNIATTTRELPIDGNPTRVSVFRLGRTALFYLAADGSAAGVWDKASSSWRPLSQEYARTLRRARDMAERKRAVELLDLPIGAAQ
ncbi:MULTISPECIES: DUF3450 domain-containing protein [unclassified Pseudodesulfovibrio]|uniref:DUF3450 domain-containing protein n=1 Tax=unclassified Pseudodesulfovibrio TaxID=2661612 RepID=UPI000FEB8E34|nr:MULTISPECIES: DUF3450 domain-containing protein [unclassified Pseudodesulfovibrio]MCJ2163389.1 DUF3450 domain-containing protein [Pseudodesulfovibrio sp. S3-i]RWU06626.1 DUF3450 domain-containing protein [Pseudodesulfovibrio sp. S3]